MLVDAVTDERILTALLRVPNDVRDDVAARITSSDSTM